jgi:hypothetical protein
MPLVRHGTERATTNLTSSCGAADRMHRCFKRWASPGLWVKSSQPPVLLQSARASRDRQRAPTASRSFQDIHPATTVKPIDSVGHAVHRCRLFRLHHPTGNSKANHTHQSTLPSSSTGSCCEVALWHPSAPAHPTYRSLHQNPSHHNQR